MRRTDVLQGIRMLKFCGVFDRWESKELSQLEAAELLGVGERTFRRWCGRYREAGETGLLDRRLGQEAHNRVPAGEATRVEALYRARYGGFTAKHFHEHLVHEHGFRWSYTWTKSFLQGRGLLQAAPHRGAHRRKRPRRPLPGMMLHEDGSRYEWVDGLPACDLVVTLDDATGAIYSAILVAEEGTASTFAALLEVFTVHGLPCSLYTDRGSHYFFTPRAGGAVDRRALTQVGRALASWGSSTSRRIRRRREVGRSGRFGRCRIGCRRSLRWRALPRLRRPTCICGRLTCRSTMCGSRWQRRSLGRPSLRLPGSICARCCATRRSGRSVTTTRWCCSGCVCRSRPVRCVRIMSARR